MTLEEAAARQVLLELGVPVRESGGSWAVYALVQVARNRLYIRSITFGLYPQVAARFDTTAAQARRTLRRLMAQGAQRQGTLPKMSEEAWLAYAAGMLRARLEAGEGIVKSE